MDPKQPGNNCIIPCPFFYIRGCQWRCSMSEINDHFICSHKSSYKSHPIIAELYRGTVYQYLTVAFNTVFFIQIVVTPQQYIECRVKYLYQHKMDTLEYYEYELVGAFIDFGEPYQMETFNFVLQPSINQQNKQKVSCKIEISRRTEELTMDQPENFFSSLKEKFEKDNEDIPDALANLELGDSKPEAANTTSTTKAFLEELVCPVCENYLNPPIFNCSTGHSICKACKIMLRVCPVCKSKVTNARSYVLEKLIERLRYPCKFAEFGCQQSLRWENVSEHIDTCFYKTLKCPFIMCGLNIDLLSLTDHFELEHLALFFKEDDLLTKLISTPSVSFNSTVFDSEVFLLRFQYECETNTVKFGCMHITTGDIKNKKYWFELRFFSDTDSNQKFAVGHYCKKQFADFENDLLVVSVHHVKQFISYKSESTLHFKCLIRNINEFQL